MAHPLAPARRLDHCRSLLVLALDFRKTDAHTQLPARIAKATVSLPPALPGSQQRNPSYFPRRKMDLANALPDGCDVGQRFSGCSVVRRVRLSQSRCAPGRRRISPLTGNSKQTNASRDKRCTRYSDVNGLQPHGLSMGRIPNRFPQRKLQQRHRGKTRFPVSCPGVFAGRAKLAGHFKGVGRTRVCK